MFRSLLKRNRPVKLGGAALALALCFALVWFTIQAPEPGRDPQVVAMERDSAQYC